MVVGAKVCDLTEDLLWFVCGLYVGILTSSPSGYWALGEQFPQLPESGHEGGGDASTDG